MKVLLIFAVGTNNYPTVSMGIPTSGSAHQILELYLVVSYPNTLT